MGVVIQRLKSLVHKIGVDKNDWDKVHPNLLVLADYCFAHCETYGLPMVISSIIRPKIKGVSKTDIHAKGRAFDLSVLGWSEEDCIFLADVVNGAFKLGALSARDGKEREMIYEVTELDKDGRTTKTRHMHGQVRP